VLHEHEDDKGEEEEDEEVRKPDHSSQGRCSARTSKTMFPVM
jgi:hypothetical protein